MTRNDSGGREESGGALATEPLLIYGSDGPSPQTSYTFADSPIRPDRVVVAISSDVIGTDDVEHGAALLRIFLENLCERSNLPDEVLLYHRGVLLSSADHPASGYIRLLCRREVTVLACSESLDIYNIKPAETDVRPVPMCDITKSLLRADRVIRP